MRFLQTTASLAVFLPFLVSASGLCTSSGSLSWPPVGDCATPGKFDTLVQNCRACCMNDGPCFQACLKAGGLKRRSAAGEASLGVVPEARGLENRAVTLNCAVNEGCYKFTDGSLLCLNLGTGLYHDDVGGNGSYYSGVYTGPDGKVQTGTSTATATAMDTTTATATRSIRSSSSTATGTRSLAVGQVTSAAVASVSASSTAATASASRAAAPATAPLDKKGFAKAGFLCLAVVLAL